MIHYLPEGEDPEIATRYNIETYQSVKPDGDNWVASWPGGVSVEIPKDSPQGALITALDVIARSPKLAIDTVRPVIAEILSRMGKKDVRTLLPELLKEQLGKTIRL